MGARFTESELEKLGLEKDEKGNYQPKKKFSNPLNPANYKDTYKVTGSLAGKAPTPKSIMDIYAQTGNIIFRDVHEKDLLIRFDINPIGAPRLTRRDAMFIDPNHPDPKKRQRSIVTRYWIYKRQLEAIALGSKFKIPEAHFHIVCYMQMPQNWSKKKKAEMNCLPHQATPDADNILKGIQDALCTNDSYIWDVRISKYWAFKGSIEIYSTKN